MNIAENEASTIFKELGIEYTRRGYPDFTLIENDEIVAFVEVKPNQTKSLRKHQILFQKMCEKYGIPFIKWHPEDGNESIRALINK